MFKRDLEKLIQLQSKLIISLEEEKKALERSLSLAMRRRSAKRISAQQADAIVRFAKEHEKDKNNILEEKMSDDE